MIFCEIILEGSSQRELDTEIKFNIAAARADGAELIALTAEGDALPAAQRVLRLLKREGTIQFFVMCSALSEEKRESEFLLNKYGEYISEGSSDANKVYVRI